MEARCAAFFHRTKFARKRARPRLIQQVPPRHPGEGSAHMFRCAGRHGSAQQCCALTAVGRSFVMSAGRAPKHVDNTWWRTELALRVPACQQCGSRMVAQRTGSACSGLPTGSLHWGLSPGPSVYKTDALPLSYRGTWEPDAQHPLIGQNLPASGRGQD